MTRCAPLLLVLLLAANASGQGAGLMALADPVEAPGTSYSITDGLLTADVGSGSHQAHIRWDVPAVADMPDLKGFQVSFGTATGTYDLLIDKDITTTIQPGANEILVTGLDTSTAYYWRVRAIDSEGNFGSWTDEQTCTSEAAWSAPGSPTSLADADFPLTLAADTDYQLSENITVDSGTALTMASGATLDFNGHTITVASSGVGRGVHYAASVANTRIYDSAGGGGVICGTQAGSECVYVAGTLGTGNVVQDIELEFNGLTSWGIECVASSNGLRVFGVTFDINGGSNPSDVIADAGGINLIWNMLVYGSTFDMDCDDGRTYCIYKVGATGTGYAWENTASINYAANSATLNHGFFVDRDAGNGYIHDNDVTVLADRTRNIFVDGVGGVSIRANWNTVDLTNALNTATTSAFQIRNDLGNVTPDVAKNAAFLFNTVIVGGNTAITSAFILGGEGAAQAWNSGYLGHNTVTGIAATRQGLSIAKDHTNVYIWGESWSKDSGYTGAVIGWDGSSNPTESQDLYFNSCSITGLGDPDVDGPASSISNVTFNVYDSWLTGGAADDDSRMSYSETWVGSFNPDNNSIPTPTGMSQVMGVH